MSCRLWPILWQIRYYYQFFLPMCRLLSDNSNRRGILYHFYWAIKYPLVCVYSQWRCKMWKIHDSEEHIEMIVERKCPHHASLWTKFDSDYLLVSSVVATANSFGILRVSWILLSMKISFQFSSAYLWHDGDTTAMTDTASIFWSPLTPADGEMLLVWKYMLDITFKPSIF